MTINYTNKDNLERFVEDNIREINRKISQFKIDPKNNPNNAVFSNLEIREYLKDKLLQELDKNKVKLIREFEEHNFIKSRIVDIANRYIYYKNDLLQIFETIIFEELKEHYSDDMVNGVIDSIYLNSNLSENRKRFLNTRISAIIKKSLYMSLQNGFLVNLNNLDNGVMTANAGDSAQFLFVSRAILAGFNCSNVDVRSSRYDAVIDYKGKIFRVQVKGISDNTVSFKDRDRGGQGIDTHHKRNIGQRITSDDCDLFVAVDKQVGMCYIIPIKDIDPWKDEEIKSVNVSKLEIYKENWNMIAKLYDYINNTDDV